MSVFGVEKRRRFSNPCVFSLRDVLQLGRTTNGRIFVAVVSAVVVAVTEPLVMDATIQLRTLAVTDSAVHLAVLVSSYTNHHAREYFVNRIHIQGDPNNLAHFFYAS